MAKSTRRDTGVERNRPVRKRVLLVAALVVAALFAVDVSVLLVQRQYRLPIWYESWKITKELALGNWLFSVLVWAFATILIRAVRGGSAMKEWVKDAVLGAVATACAALVYFSAQFFIGVPEADSARLYGALEAATNELAKHIPTGAGYTPYAIVSNRAVVAENRAERAEMEKERIRRDGMELAKGNWTNFMSAIKGMDLAISIAERYPPLQISSTNLEQDFRLAEERKRHDDEVLELKRQKQILVSLPIVTPFHEVAEYAASILQPIINEHAAKCGTVANIIYVPPKEWIADWVGLPKTNVVIVSSTNCTWRAECAWATARMTISITGKKAKSATVTMRLHGPDFITELAIKGKPVIPKECSMSDTEKCRANARWLMERFIESQLVEFN